MTRCQYRFCFRRANSIACTDYEDYEVCLSHVGWAHEHPERCRK